MKNSILFLAVLLVVGFSFGFGCQKASDFQVAASQNQTDNNDPGVVAVVNRGGDGGCCCSLVVSSTYYGGLTICGLAPEDGNNDSCDRFCTTTCGASTGLAKTFPVGKDPLFCIYNGSPFRITNNGVLPIQIYFICNGTPSSPTWIPAGGALIYTNDCSGTTILCSSAPCG